MDDDKDLSVCILVVKEDLTCNNILAEMLRPYRYQVLHTGGGLDVLKAIWETKDRLDLVLTNANKLGSSGTEIVRHIRNTLGLPVLPISCDKRKIELKGQPFSFAAYVLTGLSINGVEKFWQLALEMEKDIMVGADQEENVQRASVSNIAVETNRISSSINDAARLNLKRKGVELSEGSKEDHPTAKKPRVVWTIEMHQKFLKAIDILGYEKAVPKKIVEVMNVPGLTRENVASHLQKFRGSMKRTQETVFSSLYTRNEFERLGVLSSPLASRLSSSQTAYPRSSYVSAAKESITPSKSHYLNTREDFSFGATLERKAYTSIQGLSFSDQSGVDKLQQNHVPKLHFTPNFRIYNVEKRNMLLSIDENSSSDNSHQSNISKFVGYRVTSDGKSVEYGNTEASIDNISTEALVSTPLTSGNRSTLIPNQNPFMSNGGISHQPSLLGSLGETSFQGQSVSGIHGDDNLIQSITSFINVCGERAIHSSHGQKIENLFNLDPSTPLSITPKQHISLQPFGDSGDEEDTEKCFSLVDQITSLQPANVAPFQNPSDVVVQNASTPSSMRFHRDQEFSIPPLEFLEGISEEHYPPSPLPQMLQCVDECVDESGNDDPLRKGTGSTYHHFDLEEFDHTLFSEDD